MFRHEDKPNRNSEGFSSILRWVGRDRVPTNYKQREYRAAHHLHSNDGGAGTHANYLSREEFAYRAGITLLSAGAFGIGIGQLIAKAFGW